MSRRMVISEHAELAGQLADVDGLLLRDAGQDRVPAIARRARAATSTCGLAEGGTRDLPDHRNVDE